MSKSFLYTDGLFMSAMRNVWASENNNDFLGGDVIRNKKRIFPVVVAATMSSGKSTLINALLGNDILPSKNEACTAKVYSILDDDSAEKTKLFIRNKNGEAFLADENISKELSKANLDSDVSSIFIVGQVKGVTNTEKSLLIIDTPGPNNSMDKSHENITKSVLSQINGGMIVYVINATAIGSDDDFNFLSYLKDIIDDKPDLKTVFVINKTDCIDYEKESIQDVVIHVKRYIENIGFNNPDILPVSALAANVMKKAMQGEGLTRKETAIFLSAYEIYKQRSLDLSSFSVIGGTEYYNEYITVQNVKYKKSDINAAIENTGIVLLENFIQKEQINSSKHHKMLLNI